MVVAVLDFSSSNDWIKLMLLKLLIIFVIFVIYITTNTTNGYLAARNRNGFGIYLDYDKSYDWGWFLSARKAWKKWLHLTIKIIVCLKIQKKFFKYLNLRFAEVITLKSYCSQKNLLSQWLNQLTSGEKHLRTNDRGVLIICPLKLSIYCWILT